jgi:hypothetical protein
MWSQRLDGIWLDPGTSPRRIDGRLPSGPWSARKRACANAMSLSPLSPLVHHHINFQGRYSFALFEAVARGELCPLRDPDEFDS